jgi:hypothetical protein
VVAADAKLDGKYLLRTSDPHLSTEDIALSYKQLLEVERGWRDRNRSSTCARCFPSIDLAGSKTASAPTSCSAGSPCSWPGSSKNPGRHHLAPHNALTKHNTPA